MSNELLKPVREHMVAPIHTIRVDDRLTEAERKMRELGVSGLPVVDSTTRLTGVITRTDLLQAGRMRVAEETREHVLSLPAARVREHMNPTVEVVPPDTKLADAAKRMADKHYHRLFVTDDGRLLGVVSTREMMRAVAQARITTALSEIMTTSLVVVNVDDPLVLAVDRMAATRDTGLVVVEHGWPVGIFSQIEALAARDAPPQRPVEDWMSPSFLPLPSRIPTHRAAAQALVLRAHRILAVDEEHVRGIATGIDFTRVVAAAE